jgi:hypothetical protein
LTKANHVVEYAQMAEGTPLPATAYGFHECEVESHTERMSDLFVSMGETERQSRPPAEEILRRISNVQARCAQLHPGECEKLGTSCPVGKLKTIIEKAIQQNSPKLSK